MAPKFTARRRQDGIWFIEIVWPNGKKEQVGEFSSSGDAHAEIKGRLDTFNEGEKRYQTPLRAPRPGDSEKP